MSKQGDRINFILTDLGISAAQFAREVGVKPASVSQWRNQDIQISKESAALIEKRFPKYSAEWIRGRTDFMNSDDALRGTLADSFLRSSKKAQGVAIPAIELLSHLGYFVTYPHQETDSIEKLILYWSEDIGATVLDDMGVAVDSAYLITISNGIDAIQVSRADFLDFANELLDFAKVRIDRLFKESRE